jgi:toxin ParE1/3/4
MTAIKFRKRAKQDLIEIRGYFSQFSDETARRVIDDIYRAINLLDRFPMAGRQLDNRKFRRLVSRRYQFIVSYLIEGKEVIIVGIHRFQDREI